MHMEGKHTNFSSLKIMCIREGTQFIVSFTPVEYGKMKTGKLIIQTDEMYW